MPFNIFVSLMHNICLDLSNTHTKSMFLPQLTGFKAIFTDLAKTLLITDFCP